MEQHRKVVTDVEKKIKTKIETGINKVLQDADSAKAAFQRTVEAVGELTGRINEFMQKFDQVKEEMTENGRTFENFQAVVETKKLERQALETEIQNIDLLEQRQRKQLQEMEEERKTITKQVEALRKLANAFKEQHRALTAV